MIRVLVSGATGAMGEVLIDLIKKSEDFKVSAGFSKEDKVCDEFTIYSDIKKIKEKSDVIIDFSSKDSLDSILSLALDKNIPLVIASTGFDDKDLEKIKKASEKVPIVQSGNFSLGVNVMVYVSKLLSKLLDGFEIEIIEAHHNKKRDAPSGTANILFDAVNEARDNKLSKLYGREGFSDSRNPNEVGIHSLRAGSINGDHEVVFAGLDEVVSISHHAQSKKIFAIGALKAAKYILDKENGLIDIKEILNIGE
ncbi:4-hydroxy-tetrahydrodipicolinate reductase [Anaerococcus sp. WCA-380-WT-2B]|uniref:4-hydroxy-tetrahydrodipicolinate reductase n=1 Tax=Anaerococcus porci TaxID=2652269 RepID=A0A6N7VU32_9FIRM|nr:4-hydroxy-tetrahydrodipicolinate reductase [Anaerococcus porci]MSS77209.1 4-hydroxy-tetrahydrodipicolinate reductase [Anaerococcus porci]